MLFLYRARLLMLSEPKTGTTATINALKPRASLVVNGPPEMKHTNYRKFLAFVAPWIKSQTGLDRQDYDVVSVMREPIDWLGSWYRYRTRDELKDPAHPNSANYTGNVSFDEFVRAVMLPRDEKPQWAMINTPCTVALKGRDSIGVDRIFPYEDLSGLHRLIEERTGKPVEAKLQNVSPSMDLVLDGATRQRALQHFAFACELHASLKADGSLDPRFKRGDGDDEPDEVWA